MRRGATIKHKPATVSPCPLAQLGGPQASLCQLMPSRLPWRSRDLPLCRGGIGRAE